MPQRPDIVFSVLTRVEAEYWGRVALRFRNLGCRTAFLLFDEAAARPLRALGLPCVSAFTEIRNGRFSDVAPREHMSFVESFGILNLKDLYLHERLGYGRHCEDALVVKTLRYLQIADRLLSSWRPACVVQELGGFAAYQAVYYAARKQGIPHIFYEPAPFPKRILFNLNSFYSDLPERLVHSTPSQSARSWARCYLETYKSQKSMVVPAKDRHSFRDMKWGRMFNWMNARRLSSKLYRKYVTREREEFNEIGHVVRFNLLKLLRRAFLSRWYAGPEVLGSTERFVYYPLHVPHDVQLSVRSKLFYNQEAFVEYLSRVVPDGYRVYVKEHPAAIGAHDFGLLTRLVRRNPNVRLIHPLVNSFDIIQRAELVVTVNSKVGLEALMQGKRVLVVGKAFYRNKGLTYDVQNLEDLGVEVSRALSGEPADLDRVTDFAARVYEWSYPCDLFETSQENVQQGFQSLLSYLQKNGLVSRREGESAAAVVGSV